MGFLGGWLRRKSKTVNGSSAQTVTGYQLGVFVVHKTTGTDTDSGDNNSDQHVYVGTNVRDDFGDVRFTDIDGTTLLDYYMLELDSGVSAKFWVKVDIGQSASKDIYVYYDNSGATYTGVAESSMFWVGGLTGTPWAIAPGVAGRAATALDTSALFRLPAYHCKSVRIRIGSANNGTTIIYTGSKGTSAKFHRKYASGTLVCTSTSTTFTDLADQIEGNASEYFSNYQMITSIRMQKNVSAYNIYTYIGNPAICNDATYVTWRINARPLIQLAVRQYVIPDTTFGAFGDEEYADSVDLLCELIVRNVGAADLPAEFVVKQWREDLPAEFEVGQGAEDLPGEFEVGQGAEDLLGKFEAQGVADLLGNFEVQHSGSAELLGKFDVGQDSQDLLGRFEAQGVADLLGKFEAQDTADLLGKFDVGQDSQDLLGRFEAQGVVGLLGKFDVGQGSQDLLGNFEVKNTGSAELLGNFDVNKPGSAELLSKTEIQQSGSAELLGNVEVRQSGSAELLSTLRVSCPRLMGENWQRKMWFDGTYYWRGRYDPIGDELIFEYIASAGLAGNTWTKNEFASINASGFTGIDADFTVRGGESGIPTTIHYSDGVDTWVAESDESSLTGWVWENTFVVFDGTSPDAHVRVNLGANRTTPISRLWAIAVFDDYSDGKQWVKARRQTTGGVITGWDAEVDISDVDNLDIIFGCSVRSMGDAGADKNDMMVVYKEGAALRSRYYTGSWQTIQDIDTATLSGHSAFDFEHGDIAGMNMAHLLYIDADNSVQWREREYGGASVWSGASQLHAADVGHHSVGIIEHGSGWLWAVWKEGDLIEYRSHDCDPETWYPPLASDPLTFDVSTEAVVDTSTIAQLQTPDAIPSGEAVPICWIGETAPTTPCDVGWGILVEYSIASLKGVFDVRQPSSVELLGKFEVGQDSTDLLARFEAQGVADLLAKFETQDTAELPGEVDIRQLDSAELLGTFEAQGVADLLTNVDIRQLDSADLLGRFEAQGVADLLGKFEAQGVADLLAKFEAQSVADLLANVDIRQLDSADLLGKADIGQDSQDLLARFEAQGVSDLLGKFDVGQDSQDLLGRFEAQGVVDLLGKFEAQDTADLLARFEAQGVADLLAKFEAQDTADLLGKFDVGQDSQDLLGRFEAQGVVGLLGKFDVGQDSQDLLGRFEAQAIADLLGKFKVQAVTDLLANVEVQQSGSAELVGNVEVQQLGVSDLISNFYVSPSYLTADEMLIGGRDRRMDLGGLDREMVVGGRDRRMKIK